MMDNCSQLIDTSEVQVNVTVRIGSARLSIAQLSALQSEDVLTLEQCIGDGVEICVGDKVVARGELTGDGTPNDRLCIRISGAAELS